MKTFFHLLIFVLPLGLLGQFEASEDVVISKNQDDDIYLAGESIRVLSQIQGDVVAAGSNITIKDSVAQDVIVAGGDITIQGVVGDDVRIAGGSVTITNEVKDDVIVFAGELTITENAKIHGNLVNFSGTVDVEGDVAGEMRAFGGDLTLLGNVGEDAKLHGGNVHIDGQIRGKSTIVAEEVTIGENARFYGDIEYWSEEGEVNFESALAGGSQAYFNEDLKEDREEISWKAFGLATFGFWVFYLLSAFLVLLILNWALAKWFQQAVSQFEDQFWKGFGYGMIYLIGLPLLIIGCFVIIIGAPIGLFLFVFYLFSLFFGHLVAASLLAHYWNLKNGRGWGFWPLVFLALGIALVLRLLTLVPFLGVLVSIVILAFSYGLLLLVLIPKKGNSQISTA